MTSVKILLVFLALAGGFSRARAQDIEPRAYSNAPIGVNFLIAGFAATRGGVAFDPSLPVTNPDLRTSNALLAYARVLDLLGRSAKFDVILPYTSLSGSADYQRQPLEREANGLADARFRLSWNFYGAPALRLPAFRSYEQDLILGASLQVSAPTGQYDPSRLVNIGSHRWWFKPELGASKAMGPWTLELAQAVTFYTDNRDFYGGHTRTQDPLFATQAHLIYGFRSGAWGSFDVTWFAGGRSAIDGVLSNDLQRNWRLGGTLALPIDRLDSIKLSASRGVASRTGNDFDFLGIAWQRRWGGGL
ncbi:MAG: transporter [Sphingomonadaceae bacterium]